MATISMTTLDGARTAIPAEAVAALASRMRGALHGPDDAGYDQARSVWNGMIDRRPGLIARCAGASDVMQAVAFARSAGLLLSVRGGGHHIGGLGLCDGGLAIDLSPMRSVRVDPIARVAHVEGGATLAEVDHETQAFGLATPLGINSTTGLAGLALGGGFGWLTRKLGMTVDNLIAADVVTADARMVRASTGENDDLFWALRGGGGNFGVVTRFELALHPVGPEVLAGLVVFPLTQARSILATWRELGRTLPEETSVWIVMRHAPPLPFLAPDLHGAEIVVAALCHTGDAESGRRALDAVRVLGTPLGEHVGPQPYAAWQRALDPLLTPGARNYWKSHNFVELTDDALDRAIAAVPEMPSPECEVFFAMVDGAPGRRAPGETAYSARDARFVMNVHGRWTAPTDDARCIAWARDLWTALQPHASAGAYVNFMTADEGARVPDAYGRDTFAKLSAIKARWDPENLFRVNQNIPPRAADGAGRGRAAKAARVEKR